MAPTPSPNRSGNGTSFNQSAHNSSQRRSAVATMRRPFGEWTEIQQASKKNTTLVIDPDGRQLTLRTDKKSGLCRCCKRETRGVKCKGTARSLGNGRYVQRTPHTCVVKSSAVVNKRVNAAAKQFLKDDHTKSARAVVFDLLKDEHLNNNDVSLPIPDNIIRNCQRAVASKRPKHPHKDDIGFSINMEHIPEDFLMRDLKTPEEGRTERRALMFSNMKLLKLLHGAKLWTVDGTFSLVQEPLTQLHTAQADVQHKGNVILLPFVFS